MSIISQNGLCNYDLLIKTSCEANSTEIVTRKGTNSSIVNFASWKMWCVLLPEDTKGSENMVCEVISVGRLNTSLFVSE